MLGGRAQPVPLDRRLGPQRHGRAGRGLRRPGPPAWAELLADLAVVVRAFGALLRAEVEGGAAAEEAAAAVRRAGPAPARPRLARRVLLANPREHPDLWELDGALVALVDRMLLELDTAAHAKLWEDHRRDVLDRHRATDLFERLRSRRGDERAAGTETPPPEGAPPEERPSREEKPPRRRKPPRAEDAATTTRRRDDPGA